ncbi:MAG: hypothetical protein ACXWDO_05215 [Bacteroidia bacterium]
MQNNAIKFTLYEKQIIQDTNFLIAKRHAMQKVDELFSVLQQKLALQEPYILRLENALNTHLQGAKISKGENYKGLPYVVLDFPKYIIGNDVFLFRSMFWWGNFYSFSIFLQGEPLEKLKHFFDTDDMAKDAELYIGLGDKLWEYDYTAENYVSANTFSATQLKDIMNKNTVKLSYKFPVDLSEEEIIDKGIESFTKLLQKIKMP